MNPNNCSLADFRKFLEFKGCKMIRHSKGHYKYTHSNATRPIVLQDHIDPVPPFIVQNSLRNIGATAKELRDFQG